MLRHAFRIAWKDLRIEVRSKEIFMTMAFFGALLVVIYTFAFPPDAAAIRGSVPGMLWVAIAFTGTIALGRAFDRERENDTMRALLLAPVPRLAVFLGKAIAMSVLILGVAVVVTPAARAVARTRPCSSSRSSSPPASRSAPSASRSSARCSPPRCSRPGRATCCCRSCSTRSCYPLFVAGAKCTASLVAVHPNLEAAHYWIGFVGIYDAAFLVLSVWVFESLVIE